MKFIICLICIISIFGCSKDEFSDADRISNQITQQLAKQMKPKGLNAIGFGGGEKNGKINLIEVTFVVHEVLSIEMARKYMVETIISLMNIINRNNEYCYLFEKFPIEYDILSISIIGQEPNKNTNNVQYISIWKDKICYIVSTEIQELKPLVTVYEETIEEAKKIVAEQSHTNCQLYKN